MNQRSEEEKIRRLFHELREEDDQCAPSFSSILEARLSKTGSAKPGRFIWRAAMATASIILIVGLALLLRQYSSRQNTYPAPTDESIARAPYLNKARPAPQINPVGNEPQKPVRRKARPAQFRETSRLISRWQSPTDFLLRTPGAELLKNVPRITDSAVNLKSIPTAEKN